MVADAVAIEPVSAPEFPANREKNREFFNFGGLPQSECPQSPMISGLLNRIPYALEQGISEQEQGNSEKDQGISGQSVSTSLECIRHWCAILRMNDDERAWCKRPLTPND